MPADLDVRRYAGDKQIRIVYAFHGPDSEETRDNMLQYTFKH